MDVIKLAPGERAPRDSDCAKIEALGNGRYNLSASALASCGDADTADSVAMVGGDPYPSYDEAEAAALAWASSHGVDTLYVEAPES